MQIEMKQLKCLENRTQLLSKAVEKAAKMSQKPTVTEEQKQYHLEVKQINTQLMALYKNEEML